MSETLSDTLMLAIETSSFHGSVALGCGEEVLACHRLSAERRHTTELLPAIADLLANAGRRPADVNVLCYSQGPGSFTGLRVAATIARMWQSAQGCDVVAVPTLQAIARNALAYPAATAPQVAGKPNVAADPQVDRRSDVAADLRVGRAHQRLAVILDARQGKLFGAEFLREGDELHTIEPAGLHPAEEWLSRRSKPCWVLGEGLAKHAEAARAAGLDLLPEEFWRPDARQVLAVGRQLAAARQFCKPDQIIPTYLRPPECEEVYEQRRAEARARRGE